MTVISAIVSRYCVAHASDSYITECVGKPKYKVKQFSQTKVVAVPRWKGIVSYFGLAEVNSSWTTLGFLRQQIRNTPNFGTAAEFAQHLAQSLNIVLSGFRFQEEIQKGIGVHFSAYEEVAGHSIPELFHITNYRGTSYMELLPGGVRATRETYANLPDGDKSDRRGHHEEKYRLEVFDRLMAGHVLLFNNGDPTMYNAVAGALAYMLREASRSHPKNGA